MSDANKNFFEWNNFRYDKKILPHKKSALKSSSVAKISSKNNFGKRRDFFLQIFGKYFKILVCEAEKIFSEKFFKIFVVRKSHGVENLRNLR